MPTRASTAVLNLLEDFTAVSGPLAQATALLGVFDSAGWFADGYELSETPEGPLTTLRFASAPAAAALALPGLSATAHVGLATDNGAPVLRVLRDAAERWLQVGEVAVTLELDTAFLRPLDPAAPSVRIEAALAVRVDRNWGVEVLPRAAVSLPWCRVAGLPIELRLDNLQFDFRTDRSPPEITALGFDASYLGIYAETATLRLLPELKFGAQRGIELRASALAIGSGGLSARLAYFWHLAHDGHTVDPASQLTATLFDALAVGLGSVELSVRNGLPQEFRARGVLRLPLLPSLLGVEFGLQPRPGGARLCASADSLAPIAIALGPASSLDIAHLRLQGDVEANRLALVGSLEQLSLSLGAVSVSVASANLRLDRTPALSQLTARLGDVALGPLGTLPNVDLVLRETTAADGTVAREAYLAAQIAWRDVRDRVQVPANLPSPPDDATVAVKVSARDDGVGGVETALELSVSVSELDFGSWLPDRLRVEARNASLVLSIAYSGASFRAADASAAIAVTASGAMQLRLPDLTLGGSTDLLHVTTGEANGWVSATFSAGVNAAGEPFFDVAVTDALAIEVQLPGLQQPVAPIIARIDSLRMDIRGAGVVEGAVVLGGRLELRPIAPPRRIPIATHVEQLFAAVGLEQVIGDCQLALRFNDNMLQVELSAAFENTGVSLDLFGAVANLASGLGATSTSDSVPLSLEAGIHLDRVSVRLGSLDPADTGVPFAVEVVAAVSIGGLGADCVLAFSDDEILVGIRGQEVSPGRWNTDIPLALPRFPVRTADLDLLAANGFDTAAYRAQRAQQLAVSLGVPDLGGDAPRVVRARTELEAATFFLEQVATLRSRLDPASRATFTDLWARNFVSALETLTGWFHTDSDIRLRLEQFALRLPLADPRNLGVEGTLRIVGIAPDDPLAGFNDTALSAGISADLVYFALEGTGAPFDVPGIGRWSPFTVSLGQLRIGYGYTSNSFNVVIDGAIEPPRALVEDIDTSEQLGVGVRLPSRNALYFRLGLIPVPGPVPVVPVFDFNLDLREPNSLPLVDAARAIPYWDGLQFIADGLFRVDLKHLAASPMLGPLPIPNFKYDGDWLIGNDDLGFTVIADNVHVLLGIGVAPPTPIPYLADPQSPYFDNLVLNVRIAGFKLNLNLQHPFPSFNPLALLELFALLSDPTAPVDPDGPLANILRVSVKDVRVELPQWARQLFPESEALLEKPGEFTLNVGTALSAIQALLSVGMTTLDAVTDAASSLPRAIRRLPELVVPDVDAVLAVLPPEMRKVRLGGAMGGFKARVVILLISPDAARRAITERDAAPSANVTTTPRWGDSTPTDSAAVVAVPLGRRGVRESRPSDPPENLFRGIEFASFHASDLDGVLSREGAAIVVGAHVKVFESQRYRFLGIVSSDGSFLLVTTADTRPLRLRVAGIDVRVPFEASARMRLEGRTRRDGFYGRVTAQGYASWRPIPDVLSIDMGSKEKPIELTVYGDGAFHARGHMHARLFQAAISGSIDASNTHCFIAGSFSYSAGQALIDGVRKPLIALEINAEGRVGPGNSFRIAGAGSLRILDQAFSNVRGVVTDHSAQVSASIDTERVSDLTGFPMAIKADLTGSVDLRRGVKPSFSLEGRIEAEVFDFAIKGAGRISSRAGQGLQVGVEGSLYWGGHEWLGGFLEVGKTLLRVGGRTRFAVPLTHPGTGNAQFAHLFCEVNVGGSFRIDANQSLASWRADASVLLGMRLPSPSKQFIPLAAYSARGHGIAQMRLRILNFQGFEIPGLPDVNLEVPKIVENGSIDVDYVTMGVAGLLEIGVPYLEGTPGPKPKDWLGFVSRKDLLKIPLLSIDGTETINLSKLVSKDIKVDLTFNKGDLVLEIAAGDDPDDVRRITLVDVST